MIFGVDVLPEYRHHGIASTMIRAFNQSAKEDGLSGVVLTCKKELIPLYESCGFCVEGISESTHGNVIWYQMRCIF